MSTDSAVPRLLGLATALPSFTIRQGEARAFAAALFDDALPELARLLPLFDNTGIATRQLAMPPEWYGRGAGFALRNAHYLRVAEDLLVAAATRALDDAGLSADAIDAVVTVSSTGIATPSLDARIADRLGLRSDVERTPVFGLGCAGGVLGLGRAAALARARPGCRVLLLVVELCSLALRTVDRSKPNLVACALFGDGAAAAVIGCDGGGEPSAPALVGWGEHRWPDSLDVMGWEVADDGLGVLFSIEVPAIVRQGMGTATDRFLASHRLVRADVERFVCHPGGAKVVDALEAALGLAEGTLADARAVLRDHGNMSAPTVLFVLARALADPAWRRGLVSALGPGFCAGFVLIERAR